MQRAFPYRKIIPDKIDLLSPLKCGKNKYRSVVTYSDCADLVIQTPKVKISGSKIFVSSKKKEFKIFLEELYIRIIKIIHLKSIFFFNGKEFSEEFIKDSIKPFYQ